MTLDMDMVVVGILWIITCFCLYKIGYWTGYVDVKWRGKPSKMTLDEITKEIEATILSVQPELKIIPQQYYEPNEQYLVTKFCAIIVLFGVWVFESEDFDTELEAASDALKWLKERGE